MERRTGTMYFLSLTITGTKLTACAKMWLHNYKSKHRLAVMAAFERLPLEKAVASSALSFVVPPTQLDVTHGPMQAWHCGD